MTELQTTLTRFSNQQEESMRQYATEQMQKEHVMEKENIRLQAKIAETAEQLSNKSLQRELKFREELQTRHAQLEQVWTMNITVCCDEKRTRSSFESESYRRVRGFVNIKNSNKTFSIDVDFLISNVTDFDILSLKINMPNFIDKHLM